MRTIRTAHDAGPTWFNAYETAEALDLSLTTTYLLLAQGHIPGVRVGRQWRVSTSALEAFLSGE